MRLLPLLGLVIEGVWVACERKEKRELVEIDF